MKVYTPSSCIGSFMFFNIAADKRYLTDLQDTFQFS